MHTHAVARPTKRRVHAQSAVVSHSAWLAAGCVVAFAIPFLLADLLEIHRDVFYGLYAIAVFGLIGLWARSTGYDLEAAFRRRWPLAVGLGAACAGVMALMVVRTEDATARPDGVELAGAVLWRGVVYGISDGLLLSVFPILVVFAALAGSRLNDRAAGKVVIGGIALIASLAMTAVYHLGYSDFRSDKVAKPLAGDVLWSVPTLVTLNPIGAPIAHVGLHVSAVLHSYQTDTFLPPHVSAAPPAPASTAALGGPQRILARLVSGAGPIAPGATGSCTALADEHMAPKVLSKTVEARRVAGFQAHRRACEGRVTRFYDRALLEPRRQD